MARSKVSEIEAQHGKPLEDVLQEAFRQHKTQSGVARALGVEQSTVFNWLLKLGVEPEVRLVPRAANRPAGDGHTSDGQMPLFG